ncbi:hypothetical protein [Rhizobium sp. AAP43]|uniref:hypothetical protein n=1 Tax=Rhizobium sp. AAP43 TaxID=1523420 RepID=UPI0006B90A18|nr:hypothetical protein [Rhizobium sp. AAP43]KPF47279.1 hypothetical protein IP76_00475 [Rhizobium sp. AAP43]
MRANRLALAALAALIPAQAMAGFVDNYAKWKEMPQQSQLVYLAGAVDTLLQIAIEGEPKDDTARREGILTCFDRQAFDAERALELVNNHYKEFPVDGQYGPSPVLFYGIIQMCLPQINEERAKLGLPAAKRLPRQLSRDTP